MDKEKTKTNLPFRLPSCTQIQQTCGAMALEIIVSL